MVAAAWIFLNCKDLYWYNLIKEQNKRNKTKGTKTKGTKTKEPIKNFCLVLFEIFYLMPIMIIFEHYKDAPISERTCAE
jgi:hypothetical protein